MSNSDQIRRDTLRFLRTTVLPSNFVIILVFVLTLNYAQFCIQMDTTDTHQVSDVTSFVESAISIAYILQFFCEFNRAIFAVNYHSK